MKLKQAIILVIITVVSVTIVNFVFLSLDIKNISPTAEEEKIGAGVFGFNRFSVATTSTVITVSSSSTELLGSSTRRTYASITNTDEGAVCINMDEGNPAVFFEGICLEKGDTYEINTENMYLGRVLGISTSTNVSRVAVYEIDRRQ